MEVHSAGTEQLILGWALKIQLQLCWPQSPSLRQKWERYGAVCTMNVTGLVG